MKGFPRTWLTVTSVCLLSFLGFAQQMTKGEILLLHELKKLKASGGYLPVEPMFEINHRNLPSQPAKPDPKSATESELVAYYDELKDWKLKRLLLGTLSGNKPLPNLADPKVVQSILDGADLRSSAPFLPNPMAANEPAGAKIPIWIDIDTLNSGQIYAGFSDGSTGFISKNNWKPSEAFLEMQKTERLEWSKPLTLEKILSDPEESLPVFQEAKLEALRMLSLSNLKQLASALILWESDHDDAFPNVDSQEQLTQQLTPLVKGNVFFDPRFNLRYNYVLGLKGHTGAQFNDPSETPVFYETIPVFRGRSVAYADGHAALSVSDEKLQQQLKAASLPQIKLMDSDLDTRLADVEKQKRGGNLSAALKLALQLVSDAKAMPAPDVCSQESVKELGSVYEKMGRYADAFQQYGLLKNPHTGSYTDLFTPTFELESKLSRYSELLPQLEASLPLTKIEADLENGQMKDDATLLPSLLILLSTSYEMTGHPDKAMKVADLARDASARTLSPLYPEAVLVEIGILGSTGQQANAKATFTQSLELQNLWTDMSVDSQLQDLIDGADTIDETTYKEMLHSLVGTRELANSSADLVAASSSQVDIDGLENLLNQMQSAVSGDPIGRASLLASEYAVASTEINAGRIDKAANIVGKLQSLQTDLPIEDQVRDIYVHHLQGLLDLRRGSPTQAIAELTEASNNPLLQIVSPLSALSRLSEGVKQDLALAHAMAGDTLTALKIILEVEDAEAKDFDRSAYFSSDRQLADLFQSAQKTTDIILTLASQKNAEPAVLNAAAECIANRKGWVLDTLCRIHLLENLSLSDPEIAELKTKLAAVMAESDSPSIGEASESKGNTSEDLQKALAGKVAEKSGSRGLSQNKVSLGQLQANIMDGTCLLDFLEFKRLPLVSSDTQAHPEYFLAAVTRNSLQCVNLGPSAAVNAELKTLRNYMSASAARTVEVEKSTASKADFTAASQKLYNLLLAPVLANYKGATLLISPDSDLNRLPFEALIEPDGQFVLRKWQTTYIDAARDILRKPQSAATGCLVVAGPDYDATPQAGPPGLRPNLPAEASQIHFDPLPGAKAEGEAVDTLLKSSFAPVQLLEGGAAEKSTLLAMKPIHILHIASHGFVLPDKPLKATQISIGGAEVPIQTVNIFEDPLDRACIALSGANHAIANANNGWLTAADVTNLDLTGTDLVTLSACDTGLGDTKRGDGVYGFRRAFAMAGANNIVMSLFPVPDAETSFMMQDFYSNLAKGASVQDAFRKMKLNSLERQQKKGDDMSWSFFILERSCN
ncbi:MAG TPA: CHAT domain-containing protein [Fimbriimonadaceae bacterium]|jgi:CHAT domain-containing protein